MRVQVSGLRTPGFGLGILKISQGWGGIGPQCDCGLLLGCTLRLEGLTSLNFPKPHGWNIQAKDYKGMFRGVLWGARVVHAGALLLSQCEGA